ncbi:MAG: phosphoadenylyl-sulfate reductase [Candidatus Paceibacterales bacterium]
MEILCLIPARGNSEKIPKRNITPISGKPMIEYVFDAAKKSKLVNRIVLSTEDEEIAEIARKNNIEVPFKRPEELAGEKTPMLPVLKHALTFLKEKEDYWPDFVLMIQPTSPLIRTEQIDRALKVLIEKKVDSVETVAEIPLIFHPYNVRYIDEQGYTRFLMPKERVESIERSERQKFYTLGNLFAFKPENLFETNTVQGRTSLPVVIDRKSALGVKDPLDLFFAEHLFENFKDKIEHSKEVVAEAAKKYKNIAVGCSFGKDSITTVHLAREVVPEIPVFYTTTRYKPPETLRYAVEMNKEMNLNMTAYLVSNKVPAVFKQAGVKTVLLAPEEFDKALADCQKEHGKMLYEVNPDFCCQLLKVNPTKEAVKNLEAWISGLRKDEGYTRHQYKEVEAKGNLVKINPILEWSELDIWRYLAINQIPVNPLYDRGYRSLGCAPCSEIISDDQPERAGRWENTSKCGGECGIHTLKLK